MLSSEVFSSQLINPYSFTASTFNFPISSSRIFQESGFAKFSNNQLYLRGRGRYIISFNLKFIPDPIPAPDPSIQVLMQTNTGISVLSSGDVSGITSPTIINGDIPFKSNSTICNIIIIADFSGTLGVGSSISFSFGN